jgi:peptidoglycan/xylan/chitin deacetylase (PgdA/CDA1 family)
MTAFPFVLMYHSVGVVGDDPHLLTVTPERLEAQLAALRFQGLRGMSMRELLRCDRRGVGLTFDDGYADFLDVAVPVLKRHGCTATVFALAGRLDGDNGWDAEGDRKRLMTAGELRSAAREGMEIGSHGLLHRRLPEVDAAELAQEVSASRALLGEIVGGPVDGFAYPYGALGRREVAAVETASYSYACAVGLAGTGVRPGPHAIPRSYAGQRDGALTLLAKRVRHSARVAVAR